MTTKPWATADTPARLLIVRRRTPQSLGEHAALLIANEERTNYALGSSHMGLSATWPCAGA